MKIEKTLLILKPDTIARGIVGEVLSRFERAGLKLVWCRRSRGWLGVGASGGVVGGCRCGRIRRAGFAAR